jgi:protein-tyrosine phosphatase
MEYPHNLFPALHITLCLILADIYGRHTRGIVKVLLHAWFILIGLSTVLTWQHHLVDVAAGVVLAGFAFYFFHEADQRLPVVANVPVGCCYALGAATVLALAPALWPWGVFLLWPAAGLVIVAGGYFGLGPGIFRKSDGRLPLSSWFVFAPILIGQRLSLVYYRRRCRAWDELTPGVLIGRLLSEAEAAEAVKQGTTAVLDLTAEFPEAAAFRAATYRNLRILDLTAPTQDQLQEAVKFIAEQAPLGTVYVHCKAGYSRSGAAVAAYLLDSGQAASVKEAVGMLRRVRPSMVIRPEAMSALYAFERINKADRACSSRQPVILKAGAL